MKKIACILIVLVLLINSMGYFFVFKTIQLTIKQVIKEQALHTLPDNKLCLIKLANKDRSDRSLIEWTEENEFRYHGGMYDVVRYSVQKDTTYYYCINDVMEEQLFANLGQMEKHQPERNPLANQRGSNLLKSMISEAVIHDIKMQQPYTYPFELLMAAISVRDIDAADVPSPPPKS